MKLLPIILAGIALWLLLARRAVADALEDNPFVAAAKRVAARFGVNLDVAALALLVAGESAGEPRAGQVAVAWTVRNRIQRGAFGRTYLEVMMRSNQYEPVHNCVTGQPAFCARMETGVTASIVDVALGVWGGWERDTSGGAVNFYSPRAQAKLGRSAPKWASTMTLTVEIGNHLFYK